MANPPWDSLQLVSEPTILGPNFGTILNHWYYQPPQVWGTAAPTIHFSGSQTPYGYEYYHGYFHPYSSQVRAYQVDYSNPGFYFVQMGDGSVVSMTTNGLENLFKSSYGNFCSASAETIAPKSALSKHKRRATGGKKNAWRKKQKYELGCRSNTKLSSNITIRRIRMRGSKSLEVEQKIEPIGNDADKVFDKCPERQSIFESKMLEFSQSCRRVEEMLRHMISSAKKYDNQDEDPKLEIESENDVAIEKEKILDIDTAQVFDKIPEEETEVWNKVQVFDEIPEMEETEQLNEDEVRALECERIYDLICKDYENQLLHIDGVEEKNSENKESMVFDEFSHKNEVNVTDEQWNDNVGPAMSMKTVKLDILLKYSPRYLKTNCSRIDLTLLRESSDSKFMVVFDVGYEHLEVSSTGEGKSLYVPFKSNKAPGVWKLIYPNEDSPMEDGYSVLAHLGISEARVFGKSSTLAPPQAMFSATSTSYFDLSMTLTLELIVNCGGKSKFMDVLNCTLGKVELKCYIWGSSFVAVSSSWKDPLPGSCVKSCGIAVVIKYMTTSTSQVDYVVLIIDSATGGFGAGIPNDGQTCKHTMLAFILGVKEIIYCCDKTNATSSNYLKVRDIDRVQGELGKMITCLGGQLPNRILSADFSKARPPKVTDYSEEMMNIKAIQGMDQCIKWIYCTVGTNVWFFLDTGQQTNVEKWSSVFLGIIVQNSKSLLVLAPFWKLENEDMINLLIAGVSTTILCVLGALKLCLPLIYTNHFTCTLQYWVSLLKLHPFVNSSIIGGLSATGRKPNSLEYILFAYRSTKLEVSFLWHPSYQSLKVFLSQGYDHIESSLLEYCSYSSLHAVALSLIWHHSCQPSNIFASLNLDYFVVSSREDVKHFLLLHSFLSSSMVSLAILLLIFNTVGILFEDIATSRERLIVRQGDPTLVLSVKLVNRRSTYQDVHGLGKPIALLVRMLLVVLVANHSYIADGIISQVLMKSIAGTQTCSDGVPIATHKIGTLIQQYKLMSHHLFEHNGAQSFATGLKFLGRMSVGMNISIWDFQYFSLLDNLRMQLVHFTRVTSLLRSLNTTHLMVLVKMIVPCFSFSAGQGISKENFVFDPGAFDGLMTTKYLSLSWSMLGAN